MWKKTGLFLGVLIILAGVIFDLKVGTLPYTKEQETAAKEAAPEKEAAPMTASSIPFQEVIIESGDTVLSVAEQLHPKGLPVSIDQVTKDFEQLNDGLKPEKILIGKTYRFPIYD